MSARDIDAIENGGKRWHGEDHRVVQVRWEPYKPDGQRQMKAKGRWQEQVGSGDYWRWQNCDRPAFADLIQPQIDAAIKAALEEVSDTIKMFAPSEDMSDAELSEVGRIRREMWRKQDEAIRAMIATRTGRGE